MFYAVHIAVCVCVCVCVCVRVHVRLFVATFLITGLIAFVYDILIYHSVSIMIIINSTISRKVIQA